jgi:23S rRNA (adenine2030-N6)-methyltransferase
MNYRHIYHAGNFADVIKHAALALSIAHLKAKPAAFRVIDTHAGTGRYNLSSPEALKTHEWDNGIGRLLAEPRPPDIDALLAPYLDAIAAANGGQLTITAPEIYPGSPLIARHLLRPHDRLVANELHLEDHTDLADLFAGDPQTKVMNLDGWTALKALLPPIERRGIILVDPPFEEPGELQRLVQGLREAARRFATGIVLLWYPIKDLRPVHAFRQELQESGLPKLLDVEVLVRYPDRIGLAGSGLVIMNPPFGLEPKLARLTTFLADRLQTGPGAGARVTWLAGERV